MPTASCTSAPRTPGNAGGKVFIIRPTAAKAEILDQDWLGTPEKSELIVAAPIVARGRVYVTSMDALYAIGPKGAPAGARPSGPPTVAGGNRRRLEAPRRQPRW